MKELEALSNAIKRAQEADSKASDDRMTQFQGLIEGVETALSDIVELMEGREPVDFAPLIQALKGLKLTVTVPKADPAVVTVNVPQQPAPVVNVQSATPVVHVQPGEQWKSMTVKVGPSTADGSKQYVITRT